MPDWRQLVRERLPPLPLPGAREEELHKELARQLEQSSAHLEPPVSGW